MKKKKAIAVIEASSTGFGVYCESDDLPFNGYGKTIQAAKDDMKVQIKEALEYYKETSQDLPTAFNKGNLEFEYKYDVASIFAHFGMLDATNLAKRISFNPSLLRRYKQPGAKVSDAQKQKIEAGLHNLGRELLSVRL